MLELLLRITTEQYDKASGKKLSNIQLARYHKETVMLINEKINNFLDELEAIEIYEKISKKSWWGKFKDWIWED